MKVDRYKKIGKEVVSVITGDGRDEYNILKSFARKYDGNKKLLWFPVIPLKKVTRRVAERLSGLKSLNVIKDYPGKYRISNFLYLVDREHIESKDQIRNHLKSEVGVKNISVVRENTSYMVINCLYGLHEVTVYCVISGEKKNIEEEIVKLISIKFGVGIEPNKKEIKRFLRNHQTDYEDIIERATKEELETAFPALSTILNEIEKN